MKDKKYYKIYDNKLNAIYCRDKEDYLLFNKSIKNLKNIFYHLIIIYIFLSNLVLFFGIIFLFLQN